MPTTVQFEVGPSGDYTDLTLALAAMAARTPVSSDELVYLNVAANFTLGNSTTDRANSNTDSTRHVVVRPKPGMGWRDLNPAATTTPSTGIRLTCNAGAGGSLISSAGFVFEDFLMTLTGTTATKPPLSMGSGTLATFGGLRRNWITCDTTSTYQIVVRRAAQQSGSDFINQDQYFFEDNIVEASGASGTEALVAAGHCCVQRNTIKAVGRTMRVQATAGATPVIRNNAFQGDVLIEHGSGSNMNASGIAASGHNFVTGAWTRTGTGTTYSAGTFVQGVSTAAWDTGTYRPAAGGVLIGAADATAAFKLDILNQNRGNTPDAGAMQRSAGTPLPTGTITSEVLSGQNYTVTGTHVGATSGELLLTGPSVVEVDLVIDGGNFSVTTIVPAGTWSSEIVLQNAGGPTSLFGSAVVIDDTGGSPEGPEPDTPDYPGIVVPTGGKRAWRRKLLLELAA